MATIATALIPFLRSLGCAETAAAGQRHREPELPASESTEKLRPFPRPRHQAAVTGDHNRGQAGPRAPGATGKRHATTGLPSCRDRPLGRRQHRQTTHAASPAAMQAEENTASAYHSGHQHRRHWFACFAAWHQCAVSSSPWKLRSRCAPSARPGSAAPGAKS
jgi:hypothetical protein